MGEHLICLADHTPRDIFLDVDGEARPPIIFGEECDGVQMATMAALEGAVDSSNQVMAGNLRHIEAGFEIKVLSILQEFQ